MSRLQSVRLPAGHALDRAFQRGAWFGVALTIAVQTLAVLALYAAHLLP